MHTTPILITPLVPVIWTLPYTVGQTQYHVKAPYYAGNGVFLLLCEGEREIKLNGNKKDKRWLC